MGFLKSFGSVGKGILKVGGDMAKVVATGSMDKKPVVKADFPGRKDWRKPPEKPEPAAQKADDGIFAGKPYLTRKEANWRLAEKIYEPKNKGLWIKLNKYNPIKPGETRLQYAERLNKELFGGVKDPAYPQRSGPVGAIIGDQQDRNYNFLMRKKFLEKGYREVKNTNYKEAEKRKLMLGLFDKLTGKEKK
jgi:hypothetical protein